MDINKDDVFLAYMNRKDNQSKHLHAYEKTLLKLLALSGFESKILERLFYISQSVVSKYIKDLPFYTLTDEIVLISDNTRGRTIFDSAIRSKPRGHYKRGEKALKSPKVNLITKRFNIEQRYQDKRNELLQQLQDLDEQYTEYREKHASNK